MSALYQTLQAIGFTDVHDLVLLTDKDIDNLATPTTSFGVSDPSYSSTDGTYQASCQEETPSVHCMVLPHQGKKQQCFQHLG